MPNTVMFLFAPRPRCSAHVYLARDTKIDTNRWCYGPTRLPPQATGVSDVNEVIQKMVSQESTAESLMILTKENQASRNSSIRFYCC